MQKTLSGGKVKSGANSAWESTKDAASSVDSDDIKDGAKDGYEATKDFIKEKN